MNSDLETRHDLILNSGFTCEEYNNLFLTLKEIFRCEILARIPGYNYFETKKFEQLRKAEDERLDIALNAINKRIKQVDKSKIDIEFVNSEEFARIVFQVLEKIRVDYRVEKIKSYANILISYSTYKSSNDFYKEGIINRIGKYEVEHILILKYIYENNKFIDIYNIKKIGDIEIDNIRMCVVELASDGFLEKFDGRIGNGIALGDFSGWYNMTGYGEKCLRLIKGSYSD